MTTDVKEPDLSMVPALDARRAYLQHHDAYLQARIEHNKLDRDLDALIDAAVEPIKAQMERDIAAATERVRQEQAALVARIAETESVCERHLQAGDEAIDGVLYDDDYDPVFCAVTGLPILEDDAVLEDEDGNKYLRCVLLPDEPAQTEGDEEE